MRALSRIHPNRKGRYIFMKKLVSLLLSLVMALTCATAFAEGDTVTITDHNDAQVTLPADCRRIVVCDILPMPSVLSVFFGSADRIVGMSGTSMSAAQNSLLGELYPEILAAETGFISGSEVNVEELMKLDPDIVIYNASSKALGEQLTAAGFNAVAMSVNKWDYDCIETLNQWIALLSEIFPENDKSAAVREYSDKVYAMVQQRVADIPDADRARAFFLYNYTDSNIATSGKKFFGQWWADAVGAINVAEELVNDNSVAVNMEQVYVWNPDTVFITNFTAAQPADILGNTIGSHDWSGIDAVGMERVYKLPLGLYRGYTPGADTPMTLLWMAKTVYPQLFEDVDVTAEVKAYYAEVFGVELTDAQVERIFAPSAEVGAGFGN